MELSRGGSAEVRPSDADREALAAQLRTSAVAHTPTSAEWHRRAQADATISEDRLRCRWSEGLVFGGSPCRAFDPASAAERARMAWEAAGLTRVTFHEARHASASLWLAAGVDLVEVSRILGHASLSITADVYGHRVPGAEARAARTLDRYLGQGVAG